MQLEGQQRQNIAVTACAMQRHLAQYFEYWNPQPVWTIAKGKKK